jgi:hypothetical protein
LNNFSSSGPAPAFFGGNFTSSDFSIVGSRGASGSVNGVRCFHYTGQATIGSALSNFGLGSDSISSLNFDFWLGTSDHLLHRLTMTIIPGSQSAISRIDTTINFTDFGDDSSDYIVPATSTPFVSGSAAADLTTAAGRDSQRKTDLSNIAKALENYKSVSGSYPVSQGTEKVAALSGTLYSALVPTYLSQIPIDPSSPTDYYGYKSDGTTYSLTSILENKSDSSGKMVGSYFIYTLSSL